MTAPLNRSAVPALPVPFTLDTHRVLIAIHDRETDSIRQQWTQLTDSQRLDLAISLGTCALEYLRLLLDGCTDQQLCDHLHQLLRALETAQPDQNRGA